MYDRVKVKTEAKQCLRLHFGVIFGVILVYQLIIVACDVVSAYVSTIGGMAASLFLDGVLTVGVAFVLLRALRSEDFKFADMFSGFNNFGTNCLASILKRIFTLLWTLLFIIPGIIKSYSYSMTSYILADRPELTATEAIKESQRIMNGHKADLFVLRLSFIGWLLLCVVTLGIASIYVVPYMRLAEAKFYDSIKDGTNEFSNPYNDTSFEE